MKIESFNISVACHELVTRENIAKVFRAISAKDIYYVEVGTREGLVIATDPQSDPTPAAKRRGRTPKRAPAEAPSDAAPAEPKPKRKYTRRQKAAGEAENVGVPVTQRTLADGTRVESRGRCPGGAMP